MRFDDNLTAERPTFVTHLECALTGERHDADVVHNLSRAGKPLLVRYDLAGVKKALTKDALVRRAPDLWRYRELLPVRKTTDIVSLGECVTPIVPMPRLSRKLGGGDILVKDEGRLPTGSFKGRGVVRAGSMAKVGWFDTSTLKEPYRIEGKKTMGLELAEQLGWDVPDAIFYPTGGGTGLIGMWKGFDELEKKGFIRSQAPTTE